MGLTALFSAKAGKNKGAPPLRFTRMQTAMKRLAISNWQLAGPEPSSGRWRRVQKLLAAGYQLWDLALGNWPLAIGLWRIFITRPQGRKGWISSESRFYTFSLFVCSFTQR
jgi:hypothetical protein